MPGVPRGSQTDVVVEGIKRMILEGKVGAGGRLPVEADLAEMLGVSRGSLREGVRALSAMGVLESRQGSGTYVTGLEPSTLMQPLSFVVDLQSDRVGSHVHAVRRILEVAAAREAASSASPLELDEAERCVDEQEQLIGAEDGPTAFVLADIRFHRVVAQASGNPVLAALIDAFGDRTFGMRLSRTIVDDTTERLAVGQHRAVLNALRAGDPDRAAEEMTHHLEGIEAFVRRVEQAGFKR